jgi:hypothetical protein
LNYTVRLQKRIMKYNSSVNSSSFFCHTCAESAGLFQNLNLTSTSPSTYQIDKAMKHTIEVPPGNNYNSVLKSGSTSEIDDLSKLALDAGFVEVESDGRRSLVYSSSSIIGMGSKDGCVPQPQDAFRWVLSTDPNKAHGYTVCSSDYASIKCSKCGCNVA